MNIELDPAVQHLEPLRYNSVNNKIESYTDTTPVLQYVHLNDTGDLGWPGNG